LSVVRLAELEQEFGRSEATRDIEVDNYIEVETL